MPDQKVSSDPDIATPSAQARLAGIDPGTDPTKNYRFGPVALKAWLEIDEAGGSAATDPTTTTMAKTDTVVIGQAGAEYVISLKNFIPAFFTAMGLKPALTDEGDVMVFDNGTLAELG